MPLQKLPVHDLDDLNHRRRAREVINQVLDHSFDDSKIQTPAEIAAGVTPINKAFPPGHWHRTGTDSAETATNNTAFINNSFTPNSKTYEVISGTYFINDNLNAQSNQTIEMSMGVTVKPTAWADTGIVDSGIVDINGKSNIQIYGGVIDGNKTDLPNGRIWGINAEDSGNVTIAFNQILDCPGLDATGVNAGDGWIVHGTSTRFSAIGVIAAGNVRNNAAVVQCDGWNVIGGFYDSSSGSAPGAGIDIESDNPANPIYDGALVGVAMRGNYKALQVANYCSGTNVVACAMRGSDAGELQISVNDTVGVIGNHLASNPTVNGSNICVISDTSKVRFIGNDITGSSNANERAGVFIDAIVNTNTLVISGNIFTNTETYAIRIGSASLTGDIERVIITGNIFVDCCDPAQNIPVIVIDGNSGSSFYPRHITIRGNQCIDSRSGGNEATAFVQITTNVPDSVIAQYDIGDNLIIGTTARYINCPNEGVFTGTLTNVTGTPTATISFVQSGDGTVTIDMPVLVGVSTTTAAPTITGMPVYIRPLSTQTVIMVTTDNSTDKISRATVSTGGVISLQNAVSTTFTNANNKGAAASTFTYRKVL